MHTAYYPFGPSHYFKPYYVRIKAYCVRIQGFTYRVKFVYLQNWSIFRVIMRAVQRKLGGIKTILKDLCGSYINL